MFQQFLDDFLFYLSSERGLSQNTLAAYRRDLLLFQKHLGKNSIEDVKEKDIIDHLEWMQKNSTQAPRFTERLWQ